MAKVNLKTNLSFLFILICVIILGAIQGGNLNTGQLLSGDLQQIAFIGLTLIILVVATLKPDRLYLSAYSAMTLGLIVVLNSIYKFYSSQGSVLELIIGLILMASGVFLLGGTKLSKKDKDLVKKGLKKYK